MRPTETTDTRAGSARNGIATVCLSGTLEDKLTAAASAGFDGVEIFENDLIAAPWSPEAIAARCAELGLTIDLYQPFRDLDSNDAQVFRSNLRRAEHKLDLMHRLGADTMLVCSSASEGAARDDELIARQLGALADKAAEHGLRIAYEALAWGSYVDTYEHSWEIVRRADHPALGVCLDSFHIFSRGGDLANIARIPAEKLFFVQLADAPRLNMDVLQWSRHHRLFPGQGQFDIPGFLGHVLEAGYSGPVSLEVFNDVFRQAEPRSAAVDAMRSLLALRERTHNRFPVQRETGADHEEADLPTAPDPDGFAFAELSVSDGSVAPITRTLAALGFTHTGQHRSKPVELWQRGQARVLLNHSADERPIGSHAAIGAFGLKSTDPDRSARRAEALLCPVLPRRKGVGEVALNSIAAPDGSSVFFCGTDEDTASWLSDFLPTGNSESSSVGPTRIDHVALTQPFDHFDEATLFYRSVLGLRPDSNAELAAPFGLIRSLGLSSATSGVRLALSVAVLRRGEEWAPTVTAPQHIAFATEDALSCARSMRCMGAALLPIPDSYYDDLRARLDIDESLLAAMRDCGVLYDRDRHGEYLHFYTELLGSRIFFEVVQRIDGYAGYGATNAPIRMAAHRRHRVQGGTDRA